MLSFNLIKLKKYIAILPIIFIFNIIHIDGILADTAKNQNANINVTNSSSKQLYFASAPNFQFGTITNKQASVSTDGSKPYSIIDIRGMDGIYTVQAKIGDFTSTDGTNKTLKVDSFKITTAASDYNAQQTSDNIYKQNGVIIKPTVEANGTNTFGNSTATLKVKSASLPNISTNVLYKATIVNSLVVGIN